MEKITLTLAVGDQICSTWVVPVYWTLYIGKEDIMEIYKQEFKEIDESWFSKIRTIQRKKGYDFTGEHFIIRRQGDGKYTIEDRNSYPLTYVNGSPASKTPRLLQPGDVIALPLSRYGKDESIYLQFNLRSVLPATKEPPIGQLMQCSKTGKKYRVYWEEDTKTRLHFAVRIEPLPQGAALPKESGARNIRPAPESPCPFCGNLYSVYCIKCKLFICYDGLSDSLSCAGCKQKYKLEEQQGSDMDIKTFQ